MEFRGAEDLVGTPAKDKGEWAEIAQENHQTPCQTDIFEKRKRRTGESNGYHVKVLVRPMESH